VRYTYFLDNKIMSMYCEQCREEVEEQPHRCISYLMSALQDVDSSLKQSIQRVQHLEQQAASQANLFKITEHLEMLDDIQHDKYRCDSCHEIPIKGLRFKCKSCADFDLCSKCVQFTKHPHSDFFIMNHSGIHNGISCRDCDENPIRSIRYRCMVCNNLDLCHRCYLNTMHVHYLESILPYAINIEMYMNKYDLNYCLDDEYVMHLLVTNLSIQPISRLSLRKVSGNLPFEFNNVVFDLNLSVGERRIVTVKRMIKGVPGTYSGILQLFSELEREMIGDPIPVYLIVLNKASRS
jgi:hypothetical protein